jgi:hypothetical protein
MICMTRTKPLAPNTMVRPASATSSLSIGCIVAADPIHFEGRVYQLVRYPRLGGHTVWSPIAMLELVDADEDCHNERRQASPLRSRTTLANKAE